LDHLSLYASSYVDFAGYVKRLQSELRANNFLMRDVAVRGLNNLMKRGAASVVETAGQSLEDDIWLAFDDAPNNASLKSMIQDWLQQTALTETEAWIQRCQNIMTKTRSKVEPLPTTAVQAAADIPDDEVAGFASAVAGDGQGDIANESVSGQELLKWQTRNFAMSCLSELLATVQEAILPDSAISAELALQKNVGDIVRMAFSASTANVIELRVWGLKIIDQVLTMFGKTPDPDFAEASLLEQYQAQIGSALTPAFATDSSAELASEAINVSATFIATGIVTNVDRMGRILKLLVLGLDNFAKNPGTTEIGDLKGLNSNARVMVKLALFSAWARLQIASIEHEYLNSVVQPYLAKLTPLWLSSLQEYARLRFEPDISGSLGTSTSGDLDEVYAALNRETLLKVRIIPTALYSSITNIGISSTKTHGCTWLMQLQGLLRRISISFSMPWMANCSNPRKSKRLMARMTRKKTIRLSRRSPKVKDMISTTAKSRLPSSSSYLDWLLNLWLTRELLLHSAWRFSKP
jgi:hypothetical protein